MICHDGHDVVIAKNSPSKFFCDCGAGELCPKVPCKATSPAFSEFLRKSRSNRNVSRAFRFCALCSPNSILP